MDCNQPLLSDESPNYQSIHENEPTDASLKKGFPLSTSLYLENTLAVARDHLANERTFLAWVRTSLSTISAGIAVTQLFRLDHSSQIGKPLGMAFVSIGMLYMAMGAARYFHTQTSLTHGYFPASQHTVVIATFTLVSALVTVLVFIIM
ncbi:hypothetical protein BY458DRAFT_447090 [Sporodiniella umbellata]|nr:hypothetical protein BY458DRAFT_447090 [Sporodiniella umbellata]